MRSPTKRQVKVTLEVDAAVLAWFQAQEDYEARVRAALRLYAQAHREPS